MERPIRYFSLFSGIEAWSCAVQDMPAFQAAGFAEVEPYCCELLRQRFPAVPNFGDVRGVRGEDLDGIDLIVGGSPCQDLSTAGRRAGFAGERSGLAAEYVRLAGEIRPRWVVWENVPGVLSSAAGADFLWLLRSLADRGYSLAWRVLDAQFYGVPQRRRRVFLVGHLGSAWERAASVLFEPEGVRRHPTPCPGAGKGLASGPGGGAEGGSGGSIGLDVASAWPVHGDEVAPPLRVETAIGCVPLNVRKGLRRPETDSGVGVGREGGPSYALSAAGKVPGVFTQNFSGDVRELDVAATLAQKCGGVGRRLNYVCGALQTRDYKGPTSTVDGRLIPVPRPRRLTPTECERLQGFPDGWTAIEFRGKPASDTARYRALGNSMAVPVMRWIARGILDAEGRA